MAAPNSYALESLRFPGYFVEACDVGSLVDRTHGSLRLLRVAPSNDDSDERSGGGGVEEQAIYAVTQSDLEN